MASVTVNQVSWVNAQNLFFVRGSVRGRKAVTCALMRIFNFPGGYRAAYRAVKTGYSAMGVYAGPSTDGGYVLNAHYVDF